MEARCNTPVPAAAIPMRVEVRLYATLRAHAPAGAENDTVRLTLAPGATVETALARLGLAGRPATVLVDGRQADGARVLADGDRLDIFPPLEGGQA